MSATHTLANVIIFKGEDNYFEDAAAVVEVTDVQKDGRVEIAFDLPGKLRVYVCLDIGDLTHKALAFWRDE